VTSVGDAAKEPPTATSTIRAAKQLAIGSDDLNALAAAPSRERIDCRYCEQIAVDCQDC
jgi:hypothetical protein